MSDERGDVVVMGKDRPDGGAGPRIAGKVTVTFGPGFDPTAFDLRQLCPVYPGFKRCRIDYTALYAEDGTGPVGAEVTFTDRQVVADLPAPAGG